MPSCNTPLGADTVNRYVDLQGRVSNALSDDNDNNQFFIVIALIAMFVGVEMPEIKALESKYLQILERKSRQMSEENGIDGYAEKVMKAIRDLDEVASILATVKLG